MAKCFDMGRDGHSCGAFVLRLCLDENPKTRTLVFFPHFFAFLRTVGMMSYAFFSVVELLSIISPCFYMIVIAVVVQSAAQKMSSFVKGTDAGT